MSNTPDNTLYIGIDLGTSNTEISVLCNDSIETLKIKQNKNSNGTIPIYRKQLPSLICFAPDGTPMFGDVYRLPSDDIQNHTGRVVYNTKRVLLERPESIFKAIMKSDGTVDSYSPQDIARLLLKRCQEEAVQQKNYRTSDRVMITVPCCYQMDQIQATIRAANAAGFRLDENVELITEPVAALVEYLFCQNDKYDSTDPRFIDLDRPQNILVYDLGGGTLDLAIVRIEKIDDTYHFFELANNAGERDRTIGGADFDAAVAAAIRTHLLESAAAARNCSIDEIISRLGESNYYNEDFMMEMLNARAYKIKHTLHNSSEPITSITFEDDPRDLEIPRTWISLSGGIIEGTQTLSYLDLVKDYLTPKTSRNILDPIYNVLDHAYLNGRKLHPTEVDKILITGGMCHFAPVYKALMNHLEYLATSAENSVKLTILESTAGLDAVSIGAAYSHTLKIETHFGIHTPRYFLDVADGRPLELVTRNEYHPISLINPREALFEIYSGYGPFDPGMRRMYCYPKRFNPPLERSSKMTFRLEKTEAGKTALWGTIYHPQKGPEHIQFEEKNVDTIEVGRTEPKPHCNSWNALGKYFPRAISGVYTGNSACDRTPTPGSEKHLFLTCSNNSDGSISAVFESIMQAMDLNDELGSNSPFRNLPISTRFTCLREMITAYYYSDDERRIPMFQYALYAMRQLPLVKIVPPNFPKRTSTNWQDEQKDLMDGIRNFCKTIGDLYTSETIPTKRKDQLDEEIRYCIIEWRWENLFHLCISIAQYTASTSLAADLQSRLIRRSDAMRRNAPVAMGDPGLETQSRLAQIYWNAMQKGNTLNHDDINHLEALLRCTFCEPDYSWLRSGSFRNQFNQLPAQDRERILATNNHLQIQVEGKAITIEDVISPHDLADHAFTEAHYPDNKTLRPAYWQKVHAFLDDQETAMEMVRVLSTRGRGYDANISAKIIPLNPDTPVDRRDWIRAMGFCRAPATTAKLNDLWKRCRLFREYNRIVRRTEKMEIYRCVCTWMNDAAAIEDISKDHSFEILAALCISTDVKNRRYYQWLMSCLIAAVPHGWISSQGTYGRYWKALSNAVTNLWPNLRSFGHNNEKKDLRHTLNTILFNLCDNAINQYSDSHINLFEQALANFCELYKAKPSMHDMYHSSFTERLMRLFAVSILHDNPQPLSVSCQHQYLDFLDMHYNSSSMNAQKQNCRILLTLWYDHAIERSRTMLQCSTAHRMLIGSVPVADMPDLQDIADGILTANYRRRGF